MPPTAVRVGVRVLVAVRVGEAVLVSGAVLVGVFDRVGERVFVGVLVLVAVANEPTQVFPSVLLFLPLGQIVLLQVALVMVAEVISAPVRLALPNLVPRKTTSTSSL